jgi:hypothetical protein
MTHNNKDIYNNYYDGELSWEEYDEVVGLFNQLAMEEVIDGKRLYMGAFLSTIDVIRVKRNFNYPKVNWGKTNKYKKKLLEQGYTEEDFYSKDNPDGIKYLIYHTDKYYFRFHWNKGNAKVINKTKYSFVPTRGKKGNKTKLKKKLKEDLAHLNYRTI